MADEQINYALGIESIPTVGETTDPAAKAVIRYRDGYRAARFINTVGRMVKVIGLILGVAVVGLGMMITQSVLGASRDPGLLLFFFFGLSGAIVWGLFFAFGVVLSALGRQLMAELDTAVHSSPFLDLPAKARAMELDK
jgi:hypothetical protein